MILLDTCTLIWLTSDLKRFSERAKKEIEVHSGRLFVSAISMFEICVKSRKGKIDLPLDAGKWFALVLKKHGVEEIPVTSQIAARSVSLPAYHSDPMDRFILATAYTRGFIVLTPDTHMHRYEDVHVVW